MKRKMKVTLSLLLVVAMVFGNGFTSFAVSNPITSLAGEATGATEGKFTWTYSLPSPYEFVGYNATLNGNPQTLSLGSGMLSLTGLTPSTLYTLLASINYKKTDSFNFQVEKFQVAQESTLVLTLNETVYHKQPTANNKTAIYAFGKGGNFAQYPTIIELLESLQPDYDYVTHTVIAERDEDNAGWRETDVGTVTYEKKVIDYIDKFKVVGSETVYDSYDLAKAAIEASFDMSNYDSKTVTDTPDFVNNFRSVTIHATKYYTSEPVSASFTTKAWSTVTVKFHSDYNQPGDIVKTYNDTAVNAPTPDAVEGYRFMGWFDEPEFENSFDGTVSYTEPYDTHTTKDVYAKWYKLPLSTFTVIFMDGAAELGTDILTFDDTVIDKPDDPAKSGFSFVGWVDSNGLSVDFDELVSYAEKYEGNYSATVYAKWRELGKSSFDLTYMVDGEPYYNQAFVYAANEVTLPDEPSKTGYDFIGWVDLEGEPINFETIVKYENEYQGVYGATVYAKFEKWSTFTVNFYEKDEETLAGSDVLTYPEDAEDLIKFKPLKIEGFNFIGWYEMEAEEPVNFDEKIVYAEQYNNDYVLDVYARYEAIPLSKLTINFDSRGGTPVNPLVFIYPNVEFEVPSTTRSGYTFAGWFYEMEESEIEFDEDFTVEYPQQYGLEGSLTVYAKWNALPPPSEPTTPEQTTGEPTPAPTTEQITDEPPALSAPREFFNVDQFLGEPVFEEVVEIEIDEPTPLGSALPQTGQLPAELFYGIGGLITAAGAFMKRKK